MTNAFPQFDLGGMLRCAATDGEGYSCRKGPSHEGPHVWARCEYVDPDGHHCGQPPRHPGRHVSPWYDRVATAGDRHTATYEGTETAATAIANQGAAIFEHYGWSEVSRSFRLGIVWRSPLAGLLGFLLTTRPRGVLKVVFEYRGRGGEGDQPTADPSAGNRRST
jgi:hypothetical protein